MSTETRVKIQRDAVRTAGLRIIEHAVTAIRESDRPAASRAVLRRQFDGIVREAAGVAKHLDHDE